MAILAIMGLWAVLSIVAISVNCSVTGFIQGDQAQCSHQVRLVYLKRIFLISDTRIVPTMAINYRIRRCDGVSFGDCFDLHRLARSVEPISEVPSGTCVRFPLTVSFE